eukprot:2832571-Rhodomonas_salina.1
MLARQHYAAAAAASALALCALALIVFHPHDDVRSLLHSLSPRGLAAAHVFRLVACGSAAAVCFAGVRHTTLQSWRHDRHS